MGWSVDILRKDGEGNIRDVKNIINIFMSRGYTNCVAYDNGRYYNLSINKPMFDDELPWYLEDKSDSILANVDLKPSDGWWSNERIKDFPEKFKGYKDYFDFEKISGRSFMLLNFFHEYFKLVPEDVLWNCYSKDKHFYTKADIDKIYNKKEWKVEWIYVDPNEQ